jgi:sugar O-acyltransferase (sialic acid O-acetyltransferase NeuD family)
VKHLAKSVFILGAGGMARETLNAYTDLAREQDVLGFLEESCKNDGAILNGKPVHDISFLDNFRGKDKPLLIGAIGSTKRKRILNELEKVGYEFDTVVHPSVLCSRWVKIGDGSIVTAGVIMTCQVNIGRHVILNLGARVCHDVQIGNYSTISPGVKVMGSAVLGESVFVGANATIIERIKVGAGAIIAAGAVVVKDVPEMSLVAGVPGEIKQIYSTQEQKPW